MVEKIEAFFIVSTSRSQAGWNGKRGRSQRTTAPIFVDVFRRLTIDD
jgi:hypothetical protein